MLRCGVVVLQRVGEAVRVGEEEVAGEINAQQQLAVPFGWGRGVAGMLGGGWRVMH